MKKSFFTIAAFCLTILIACNGGENTSKATETDSAAGDISNNTTNNNNASGGSNTNNNMPLSPADSTFAMKAATGGMMEVEAGNLARQNAQSERVKAYAAMMVQDHQAANQELMSLSQGRGMTIPATLPPDKQQMLESMRTMKGKVFDNHYMSMMVQDHEKTLADFQQQANSGADGELKTFAQKTLPTLQKHRDSAVAINKAIK